MNIKNNRLIQSTRKYKENSLPYIFLIIPHLLSSQTQVGLKRIRLQEQGVGYQLKSQQVHSFTSWCNWTAGVNTYINFHVTNPSCCQVRSSDPQAAIFLKPIMSRTMILKRNEINILPHVCVVVLLMGINPETLSSNTASYIRRF